MNMKKMGIQKRILLLLLAAGIGTFFVLSAASFFSLYQARSDALDTGGAMGKTVAEFAGDFTVRQAKKRISDVAAEKAGNVERAVADILADADNLAKTMNVILSDNNAYPSIMLTTPTEVSIPGNTAYIYLNRGISDRIFFDQALMRDIGTSSNIAKCLELTSRRYNSDTSCYIASENGYLIWADGLSEGQTMAEFPEVYLKQEFDASKRPWYIAAKKAGHPIVTDVYISVEGDSEITCAAPYYENGKFAGVAGVSTPLHALYEIVQEKRLGAESVNFALNEKGCVVLSSKNEGTLSVSQEQKDLRLSPERSLAVEAASMAAGKSDVALVTVDGEEYYLAYAPMPLLGWSFGTLVKRETVTAPAADIGRIVTNEAKAFALSMEKLFFANVFRTAVLLLLIFLVLVYVSRRAARHFVEPILALSEGVKEIATGNLDKKLDIRTGDELEGLSESVNEMTDDLKKYMENYAHATADKERIATELSMAQSIQAGMLPSIFPKFSENDHFDLFASMAPAREVGGDFYDFYMLDEDHLALTIADVSGKGVPASLFMVISKTILKNVALSEGIGYDLGKLMERTNNQLCENNEEMMFVTVFFGVLNLKTGEFSYVNAGHNAPFIGRTSEGRTEWSSLENKKKNFMVGAVEDAVYDERRVTLGVGDMLFVYTDGVTEAMDGDGNMYTESRLKDTLEREGRPEVKSEALLAAVREDIAVHVNGAEPSDDVTMLGIRFLGP